MNIMLPNRRILDAEKRDNSALKQRASLTFNSERKGIMGPDLYTNGGGAKYSRVIAESRKYIPYAGEVALIEACKSEVADWAKELDTVIIIGQGPAQAISTKEIPILKLLPKLKTVKLIDLSEQFNREATMELEASFPAGLIVETYLGDFNTVTPNQNYSRALVITTGSLTNFEDAPLDNFPSSIAGNYLKRFQELAKPGGKILWGYDSNSDPESLEKEYDTEVISEFILNPLNKLSSTTDVAIDATKFEYQPEFFPRGSHLAHYWAATDDQVVKIDGEIINIFEGDRFLCFSSIKLNPQKLDVIARSKDITPYQSFSDGKSKQVLHCFDCN